MDEEKRRAQQRARTRRYRARLARDLDRLAQHLARRRELANRRYWAQHDKILAQRRAYTDAHREEIYARHREYAHRNRARIAARQHEAYVRDLEANRTRDRERERKAYAADPQKHSDYMKRWRAANPERARAYVRLSGHRRRAAAGGEHIRVEDWEHLLDVHGGRCAYCHEQAGPIEADHRTPLSRGGLNIIGTSCLRADAATAEKERRPKKNFARVSQRRLGSRGG